MHGAGIAVLLAVGAITQVALFRFDSRRVVLAGLGVFLAALALIVAALDEASMALLLAGTVAGGVAVGSVFLGSLATANRLAPPGQRGQVLSAYFVACYTGVGVATEFISDFAAVLALSVVLAGLCLLSLARISRAR